MAKRLKEEVNMGKELQSKHPKIDQVEENNRSLLLSPSNIKGHGAFGALYQLDNSQFETLLIELKQWEHTPLYILGLLVFRPPIRVYLDRFPRPLAVLAVKQHGDTDGDMTLEFADENAAMSILRHIDYNKLCKQCMFASLDCAFALPALQLICSKFEVSYYCSIWVRPPSLLTTPSCPPDTIVQPLGPEDWPKPAEVLSSKWSLDLGFAEKVWRGWISSQPTCGVWLAPSGCCGELVAWGLIYPWGALGALNVDEAHRQKGFCRAIVENLAHEAAQRGLTFYSHVEHNNQKSEIVHTSLGFSRQPTDVAWVKLV